MNKPTKSQLEIKVGDFLIVTKDDGTAQTAIARSGPWKMGVHTWVVLITGISGAYDLARCKKTDLTP